MLQRVTLLLICLVLLLSGVALAQLPGTMYGDIRDENDEPIAGVTIAVTDPEAPDLLLEFESDKRGRYTVFVPNSLPRYNVELKADGFQPKQLSGIKIPARQRMRANLKMTSLQAAQQAVTPQDPNAVAEESSGGGYVNLYNQGVEALNLSDLATAEARFQESLSKQPDYGPAHAAISKVYWKQEKWEEAKLHAEKSVEINPDDQTINQVLYAAYSALGENGNAETILAKMQASNPEKAGKNMYNQAADLYNGGQIAEAKELFIEILAVDPEQAKAHYMLGMCYVNEGANAEAKQHLSKFVELAPNDPDAAQATEMMGYLE